MENEIQLPDYLPSRYSSWLELYFVIIKSFADKCIPITEETKVKLIDFSSSFDEIELMRKYSKEEIYFYHEFPITLIKTRALDHILSLLPNKKEMYEIKGYVMNSHHCNNEVFEALSNIISVCPKDDYFKNIN